MINREWKVMGNEKKNVFKGRIMSLNVEKGWVSLKPITPTVTYEISDDFPKDKLEELEVGATGFFTIVGEETESELPKVVDISYSPESQKSEDTSKYWGLKSSFM